MLFCVSFVDIVSLSLILQDHDTFPRSLYLVYFRRCLPTISLRMFLFFNKINKTAWGGGGIDRNFCLHFTLLLSIQFKECCWPLWLRFFPNKVGDEKRKLCNVFNIDSLTSQKSHASPTPFSTLRKILHNFRFNGFIITDTAEYSLQ